MINMNEVVGNTDILFITLDTLRYDVAQQEFLTGHLPNLSRYLPASGWQCRHTPATFTYAAHHAFFSGFLPTPIEPGQHERLFAVQFPGSESISENTLVFESADIINGFRQLGYKTVCIGGVGFFNGMSELGSVLPDMFEHAIWNPGLGVTDADSTENQVTHAMHVIDSLKLNQRLFTFINISALHQPNYFYLDGETSDSLDSHAAALRYVDTQLGRLFDFIDARRKTYVIACSDHGTTYGDDGYSGHRVAHKNVWDVPYAEFELGESV